MRFIQLGPRRGASWLLVLAVACGDASVESEHDRDAGPDASPADGSVSGNDDAGIDAPAGPPSCIGLPDTCGPNDDEDCCASRLIPSATFWLGARKGDPDGDVCERHGGSHICSDDEFPGAMARVRSFRLDRFEVTVGRMRKFIEAGAPMPSAGAGKHGYLNGGNESGWDPSWSLPDDVSGWRRQLEHCDSYSWTETPGDNENKAVNCLPWAYAYAFCIWDGGFLPTEAEWELAASGGEERVFPWGNRLLGSRACYMYCGDVQEVGSRPEGDGKWGHANLIGNVQEWLLDQRAPYAAECNDCANLSDGNSRTYRGGDFSSFKTRIGSARRRSSHPNVSSATFGARCARLAE